MPVYHTTTPHGQREGTLRPGVFKAAVIAGGTAGNRTVTGIQPGDELISVIGFAGAGDAVTDVADLTDEFAVTADNTINNTGGTNTTGSKLLIHYISRS